MTEKTLTIEDVIKESHKRERIDIHTALPVRVVSFDPINSTVEVEPMIKQVLSDGGFSDLPMLVDVPVQFPRGGGFALTFPIGSGDEGIVIFNERCIDGWWVSGEKSEPLDYRLHDYSDAVFIPGVSSVPNAIPEVYMDGVSMRTLDDSTYFRLSKGKIYIKGDIEHEGNTKQSGDVDLTGNTTQTGNVNVTGDQSTTGTTTTGGLSAGAGGGVSAFMGVINHTGDYNLTGSLTQSSGRISSNGVVLDQHKHKYKDGTTEGPEK